MSPSLRFEYATGGGGDPCLADTSVYRPDDRLINIPVSVNGSQLWFDVKLSARVIRSSTSRLKSGFSYPWSNQPVCRARDTVTRSCFKRRRSSCGPVCQRARRRPVDPRGGPRWHSRGIDGLVGVDFFKAYVVRIDPDAQTITFCSSRAASRASGRRDGSADHHERPLLHHLEASRFPTASQRAPGAGRTPDPTMRSATNKCPYRLSA